MVGIVAALRVKRPRNRSSIPVQTTSHHHHTASYSASNRDGLSSVKAVRVDYAIVCRMCCYLFFCNSLILQSHYLLANAYIFSVVQFHNDQIFFVQTFWLSVFICLGVF